jgi:CubicO group peptidase (beta-lactamase class C family)
MTGTVRPADIGEVNWIDPPGNRWAFRHVRELTRTGRIGRGSGPVRPLVAAPRDELRDLAFVHGGRPWTIEEALVDSNTDAFLVHRRGELIAEWYFDGMRPDDPHLLMSVSKSLTSVLAGTFVGRGLIDLDATVPDHVPGLSGTSWDGCTIEHLLAMRSGTDFDEDDYADPDSLGRLIEEISGYVPRTRADLAPDTPTLIRSLGNDRAHGGRFQYRSILTDVLAWVIESVGQGRFHELFGTELWSRIGAEHDADVIVDQAGFPCAEGGICTTARDLLRFGLMVLADGSAERDGVGERVVPASWFERIRERRQDLIDAYGKYGDPAHPDACYRDMWWVDDPVAGVFSGNGINGQRLMIHHPTNTVIVKFSVWEERWDQHAFELTNAALDALVAELPQRGTEMD